MDEKPPIGLKVIAWTNGDPCHWGTYAALCKDELINSLRTSDAYIYVGNLTIIGSDNGSAPGRRQAII